LKKEQEKRGGGGNWNHYINHLERRVTRCEELLTQDRTEKKKREEKKKDWGNKERNSIGKKVMKREERKGWGGSPKACIS